MVQCSYQVKTGIETYYLSNCSGNDHKLMYISGVGKPRFADLCKKFHTDDVLRQMEKYFNYWNARVLCRESICVD